MKEGLNDRSNHCSIISLFFTISLLVLMGYIQFHGFKILKPITIHLCWLSHATIGRLMKSLSLVGRWNETIFGNPQLLLSIVSITRSIPSLKIRMGPQSKWIGPPLKFNMTPEKWRILGRRSFPVWDGMPNKKTRIYVKPPWGFPTRFILTRFIPIYHFGVTAAIPKSLRPVHLGRLPAFQLLTSWQVSTMQPAPRCMLLHQIHLHLSSKIDPGT